MTVGIVDVGTNSVRLLLAAADGERLRTLERRMTITRLGTGIDAAGRFDAAALERTVAVVAEYAALARERGADRVRVCATSAVRDAADRERFLDAVRERAGVEAEVLTGRAEAAASFAGAVGGVAAVPPVLVLDIGGGSTELIVGSEAPEASTSRQLGCVRLTERCLHDDPPTRAQVEQAAAVVTAEIDVAAEALGEHREPRTLVGVAGTVTTLGALHLSLDRYDPDRIHGTRVPRTVVGALTRALLGMRSADRAALGPVQPGREDVLPAGAMILEATMAHFGFEEVVVSEADILDGLARETLAGATSRGTVQGAGKILDSA